MAYEDHVAASFIVLSCSMIAGRTMKMFEAVNDIALLFFIDRLILLVRFNVCSGPGTDTSD